ncbi:MAG: hypothetical protein ABSF54_13575 [Bryobacteraceae bacterium]|jgi:hypothetical protein
MKRPTYFVLLMLSAMPLRGQIDEASRALTIYTRFAHPPSAQSIAYMQAELAAIMLPFHLHLDWHSLENGSGRQATAKVVVVTFKGACQSDAALPEGPSSGTLGWTYIEDGEILPFAGVDCDRIRGVVTGALAISAPVERQGILGRAMARVLAHELYHFLAHTAEHASIGIAKASYTGAELSSHRFRFDEAQLRALRESRPHRTPVETPGAVAVD